MNTTNPIADLTTNTILTLDNLLDLRVDLYATRDMAFAALQATTEHNDSRAKCAAYIVACDRCVAIDDRIEAARNA